MICIILKTVSVANGHEPIRKEWAAQGCTVIDPELCQEILRSPIYEKCALVYSKLGVVSSWR